MLKLLYNYIAFSIWTWKVTHVHSIEEMNKMLGPPSICESPDMPIEEIVNFMLEHGISSMTTAKPLSLDDKKVKKFYHWFDLNIYSKQNVLVYAVEYLDGYTECYVETPAFPQLIKHQNWETIRPKEEKIILKRIE